MKAVATILCLSSLVLNCQAQTAPAFGADCSLGNPSLGDAGVCSWVRIYTNVPGSRSPYVDRSLGTGTVTESATNSYSGFTTSGSGTAQSNIGRNSTFVTSTTDFSGFTIDAESTSFFVETFYVTQDPLIPPTPWATTLSWSVDGNLTSGLAAGDSATLNFSIGVARATSNIFATDVLPVNVTTLPNVGIPQVPNGSFGRSFSETISGTGSGSYLIFSRLYTHSTENAAADFAHTATLDSITVDGAATLSSASGQLVFDGTSYHIAAAVPEPDSYAIMLAGLSFLGFVWRRRNRRKNW